MMGMTSELKLKGILNRIRSDTLMKGANSGP